jgi:hypothetical protein
LVKCYFIFWKFSYLLINSESKILTLPLSWKLEKFGTVLEIGKIFLARIKYCKVA